MKRIIRILSVLGVLVPTLLISCGDDNNNVNAVYDLRTLSRLSEEFNSPAGNRTIQMRHKGLLGHVFIQNEQDTAPAVL